MVVQPERAPFRWLEMGKHPLTALIFTSLSLLTQTPGPVDWCQHFMLKTLCFNMMSWTWGHAPGTWPSGSCPSLHPHFLSSVCLHGASLNLASSRAVLCLECSSARPRKMATLSQKIVQVSLVDVSARPAALGNAGYRQLWLTFPRVWVKGNDSALFSWLAWSRSREGVWWVICWMKDGIFEMPWAVDGQFISFLPSLRLLC